MNIEHKSGAVIQHRTKQKLDPNKKIPQDIAE